MYTHTCIYIYMRFMYIERERERERVHPKSIKNIVRKISPEVKVKGRSGYCQKSTCQSQKSKQNSSADHSD